MAFNPNEHMMQLKGKDYLQVAWRLVWFREDHPDWALNADCLEHDADHAIFKATIYDENGIQKSSGHGSESKRDFGDFLEKAETKAIGRALAMLGYGTQFAADELDEGDRIVDSPVKRGGNQPAQPQEAAPELAVVIDPKQAEIIKRMVTDDQFKALEGKYGTGLCLMTKEQYVKVLAQIKERIAKEQANESAAG